MELFNFLSHAEAYREGGDKHPCSLASWRLFRSRDAFKMMDQSQAILGHSSKENRDTTLSE